MADLDLAERNEQIRLRNIAINRRNKELFLRKLADPDNTEEYENLEGLEEE